MDRKTCAAQHAEYTPVDMVCPRCRSKKVAEFFEYRADGWVCDTCVKLEFESLRNSQIEKHEVEPCQTTSSDPASPTW